MMKTTASPMCKKGERNLYCPQYEDCLDYAVDHRWRYWSCEECPMKLIQEATHAVRTVSDSIVFYELPAAFSRDMWSRWG